MSLRRADEEQAQAPVAAASPAHVRVVSFGFLHDAPPDGAHLVLDVRQYLRDPAAVRGLLDLDGRDPRVAQAVARTPGAPAAVEALAQFAATFPRPDCVIAIGCAGGRHRSVALAEATAELLRLHGHPVTLEHRHVHLPRVLRTHQEQDSEQHRSVTR
jgi:RNase adaptor protein for sRNA GlmZ degradation